MMERKAWKQGSSAVWKVAIAIVFGGVCFVDLFGIPQEAAAQIQFQFGRRARVGDQQDAESTDGVFLPQDRDATRQLDRAKQLLEEGRYSDAATLLDDILKRGEDYFFKPDDSKQVHRSLKMEAQRLIGSMPLEGLKAYELLFGARAEQMLKAAAAEGDIATLESVARRFFHTPAGYQATLLLGRRYLDHSQPLAAAFCFQRLLDTPHAAAQFEPGSVGDGRAQLAARRHDRSRRRSARRAAQAKPQSDRSTWRNEDSHVSRWQSGRRLDAIDARQADANEVFRPRAMGDAPRQSGAEFDRLRRRAPFESTLARFDDESSDTRKNARRSTQAVCRRRHSFAAGDAAAGRRQLGLDAHPA
jgi:hypothetical protein